MYQRSDYAYCSTNCTKLHQQALNAEGEKVAEASQKVESKSSSYTEKNTVVGNTRSKFKNSPSAATTHHQQQEQLNHQVREHQQPVRNHPRKTTGSGKQFIPSIAASEVSIDGIQKSTYDKNWFRQDTTDVMNDNTQVTRFLLPHPDSTSLCLFSNHLALLEILLRQRYHPEL